MPRYSIAVDISRCDGCGSCIIACKDEFTLNDHLPYSVAMPWMGEKWFMRLNEIEQGQNWKIKVDYIPVMCQQCEDPVCGRGAPEGAVYKRDDGIVIIDPEKAKGCKSIVLKCPYNAVSWNEEKQVPQKCTMCVHMLESGEKTTRCVESCPTQAIKFGDLDDPESEISKFLKEKDGWGPFKPEFETGPAFLYRDLPAPFITGEVLCEDKPKECVKGAKVTCKDTATGDILSTETDFLGDFEFKFLKLGHEYEVTMEVNGYKPAVKTIKLNAAKDLETVTLQKA